MCNQFILNGYPHKVLSVKVTSLRSRYITFFPVCTMRGSRNAVVKWFRNVRQPKKRSIHFVGSLYEIRTEFVQVQD